MEKADSTPSSSSGSLTPSSPAASNLLPPRSPASPSTARGRARSSSIAEMLATPPPVSAAVPFSSWQGVTLGSLMQHDKLLSITGDVPVAAAYDKMVENNFTSLAVLMKPGVDNTVAESFDYSDIASLLLLVMGHLKLKSGVEPSNLEENVRKARAGFDVPVNFVLDLSPREPFITLQASDTILTAVEYFGRGLHRLLVTDDAEKEVMGLLSQRRLVRYLWDNARSFTDIEPLFQSTLQELGIGSGKVIAIGGDKLVVEAFEKMHNESVSSLAVIDGENNLLGNISIVDVKHLTKSTSAHLLQVTCLQFLTVILTDRGLENGKDSFPVFHVTQNSTLAHTIAKLVATKSHRMWIVQGSQPYGSSPSPAAAGSQPHGLKSPNLRAQSPSPIASSPKLVPVASPSIGTGTRGRGGKLVGVVSLTDILSVLAKSAGKGDVDPSEARRQRRRSSSSSVRSLTLDANARRSVSVERGAYAPRGSMDRGGRR
ncbi:protein SDS23 [Myxozyma melibiosi]|uniref:Protein SDS23 n=1 Tax=Myxozyma melibiosi TaxID=54550 RepID=A0ABR1F241_9ASCO